MSVTLEKLDKCIYCDKKAEWVVVKDMTFTTKVRLICPEHKFKMVNDKHFAW